MVLHCQTTQATADEVIRVASTGQALKALFNLILAKRPSVSLTKHFGVLTILQYCLISACMDSVRRLPSFLVHTIEVCAELFFFFQSGAAWQMDTPFMEHGGVAATLKWFRKKRNESAQEAKVAPLLLWSMFWLWSGLLNYIENGGNEPLDLLI